METGPAPETLVSLLTDDAPSTRAAVRRALVGLGASAIPALRRASDGDDPALRARARQMLLDLRRARGHAQVRELVEGASPSLEGGLLAIDEWIGVADPALDVPGQLDGWAEDVARDAGRRPNVRTVAAAMRAVLAQDAGFFGPESDFHNVDHVALTRTVETRRGLPLTLCAVYALVARRAGFEAGLLPFPGQVLLHLGAADDRVIVDPFVGGEEVSEASCLARLCAMGAPPSPHWLSPAGDREMLLRQIRNLGAAMHRHGREREAELVVRLLADVDGD